MFRLLVYSAGVLVPLERNLVCFSPPWGDCAVMHRNELVLFLGLCLDLCSAFALFFCLRCNTHILIQCMRVSDLSYNCP
jgi:hypothetical protein